MNENKCKMCFKKLGSRQKDFCTTKCRLRYSERQQNAPNDFGCPFNGAIVCDGASPSKCIKCGWYPEVEKIRKEEIKHEY